MTHFPGEVLTQYEREIFDVEVTPRARRRILVDENGNPYTSSNKLPVEASIIVEDIEIGAIEIKDASTNDRTNVINVGTKNALLVKDITDQQKQKINNFGSANVAPSATVTLATYTVPGGKRFIFTGGIVGGNEIGEFYFMIDVNTIALIRNSGSNPTIVAKLVEQPEASAGSTIDIKVINISNKTRSYEATLNGYLIDV